MNRFSMQFVLAASIIAAALAACTSAGGFASFSNTATPAQKIDWPTTLTRTCTGLKGLDAVWQGVAPALVAAKKMPQAYIDREVAAAKLMNTLCDPTHPMPTDLPGAVAEVALASVDLGNLVGILSK